ncbi:sugar phosphate isomerase/epimerase [uncultured Parabacteroides sp.]|jgi:sugar phosphate isomerase/epimerase|uniref:sugar phosphate isomerase/epimerase family protein n=1 Tax=uncultured Parabacteroides sp. TaxID=512312 RepID=UPI0025DA514C|nr:sugar phosphate isomerase/epimerase family protein [uncultured Parabacteroides sp.]
MLLERISLKPIDWLLLVWVIAFCPLQLGAKGKAHTSWKLQGGIGVCASIGNVEKLLEAKSAFVEVNIQNFFNPYESDSAFASKMEQAKRYSLPLYSGNCFFPGKMKLTGGQLDVQGVLDYAEIAMRRAHMAGTKIFVLGSGGARNIPEGFDRKRAEEQFVGLCKRIAEIGEKYGIVLVLEPLRKEETNFIHTVKEALEFVKAVNHPYFKVLADFYHMACEKESPESIVEAADELYHCHIAEVEVRSAPGVKGDDFTPYFKALKQIGYKGAIALECNWKDFDKEVECGVAETEKQAASVSDFD